MRNFMNMKDEVFRVSVEEVLSCTLEEFDAATENALFPIDFELLRDTYEENEWAFRYFEALFKSDPSRNWMTIGEILDELSYTMGYSRIIIALSLMERHNMARWVWGLVHPDGRVELHEDVESQSDKLELTTVWYWGDFDTSKITRRMEAVDGA